MAYQHDKINQLEGGWYVVYKDGSVIVETEMSWIKIPRKRDIKIVGLKWRNKCFELEGKESYLPPGETREQQISVNKTPQGKSVTKISKNSIVGRFIGYYEGDSKVIIRLNIITGKFSEEVITAK